MSRWTMPSLASVFNAATFKSNAEGLPGSHSFDWANAKAVCEMAPRC